MLRDDQARSSALEVLARLRGLTAQDFDYRMANIPTPDGLPNVQRAAEAIVKGIQAKAAMLVVGDQDADGATGTAVIVQALRDLGATIDFTVPQATTGRGITEAVVSAAAAAGQKLVMTVDNGTNEVAAAEAAERLGVQLIITDHHDPDPGMPASAIIVNPKLGGSAELKDLAGCGVAYFVVAQVYAMMLDGARSAHRYLDFVATGTVADVVPLTYTNRLLIHVGTDVIASGEGSLALRQLAETDRYWNESDDRPLPDALGWAVAPVLNAIGRMGDMSKGIQLLLSRDSSQVPAMIADARKGNHARKREEQRILDEARMHVQAVAHSVPNVWVLQGDEWHAGVVGLAASRLSSELKRPVICLGGGDDGMLKGSIRTQGRVHGKQLLATYDAQNPGSLERYGGHAGAAGFSIKEETVPGLIAWMSQCEVKAEDAGRDSDGALLPHEMSLAVARGFELLAPWGAQWPEPVFTNEFRTTDVKWIGANSDTLRISMDNEEGRAVKAIWFRASDVVLSSGHTYKMTYSLRINRYWGREDLQLVVKDAVAA